MLLGAIALWLPFANYGFKDDFIGGDAGIAWALPHEAFSQLLGVFVDHPGLGMNAAEGIQGIFPTLAVAQVLHHAGLAPGIVARLLIAAYFFVAMLGARNLGRVLLAFEPPWVREAASLSGGLLYAVNHYTIHVFGTVQTYFPLGYIALPWILYGILIGCERRARTGIAIIAAAIVLAGGVAMNPAFFGVALLVLPIGAALMLAGGVPVKRVVAVCALGLAFGLGLCAWWLLPAPTAFGAGLGQLATEDPTSWVGWMSQRSGFPQLFKLDGYVGGSTLPYATWYASQIGSLLGYAPLLVALAGAGVTRRRMSALALAIFAMLVFLAKGVHAPAGGVYQALMDHLPGFSIFRSPYDKWAQLEALMLVVLYELGFAGLVRRVASIRSVPSGPAVAATCAILPVLLYPWPAFAGRMLQPAGEPPLSFTTSLPNDYRRVADFLAFRSRGFRTLVLNVGRLPYPVFSWGYFGEDPLPAVARVPIAGSDVIPRAAVMPPLALERAMDAIGVGFIVVHDDLRNPRPAADIDRLVASGYARLVMRTPLLRVYERPRMRTALVALAHDVALAQRLPAGVVGFAIDPEQTAQLVPNAAPQFTQRRDLLTAAGERPQSGDGVLGRASALDDVDVRTAQTHAVGAVPQNPLAAAVANARCPNGRDGVRLRPETEWSIGERKLSPFDFTFCFRRPRIAMPFVDENVANGATGEVLLENRGTHRLDAFVALRRSTIAARKLPNSGRMFVFTAPFGADKFVVAVPKTLATPNLAATIFSSDGTSLGVGFDQDGASSFVVPIIGRRTIAGEICFADLHTPDPIAQAEIRGLRSIPITLASTTMEHFAFSLPPGVREGSTIAAVDARGGMHERLNGLAGIELLRPRIAWSSQETEGAGAWRTVGRDLDMYPGARRRVVLARGNVFVTDRYRLRVRYSARGDATLAVQVDGYTTPHRLTLLADGRPHAIEQTVYPPTGSLGTYQLVAGAMHGELHLRGAELTDTGPNALLYALSTRHLGGTLSAAQRRTAWWFHAAVTGCKPCALRLAVSDPRMWWMRGATVLGTYESSGQSTGMLWSQGVTGAATWVLDGGTGRREVDVIFVPALLAAGGVLASVAVLVFGLILLRRPEHVAARGIAPPQQSFARSAEMLRALGLLAAVAVAVFSDRAFADVLGAVLWGGIVALAAAMWFSPAPVRADTSRDLAA